MRSQSLMANALTLSTLLGLGWIGAGCNKSKTAAQNDAMANRPVAVSVSPAVKKDVPVYLDGLGSVAAWKTVTVRAQVDGRIDKILFKEGQVVKKGEVLIQIDPRPFLAQLHQAEGALARDDAQLKNNRRNLERYITLRKQDLIAQQQSDDQKALVDQSLGALGVDQAQVETAKLQLSYAQITSPIDGVTGVRLIDEGNLVHANDTGGVVVVTQLDPIAVLFMLPEDDLPRLLPRQLKGPISVDAFSREGEEPLGTGTLVVVDNQINQSTATVRIKAEFRNPEHKLWPNQFIKARLLLDTRKDAIVIPAVAVQRGPKGAYVYVVGSDQTANPQPVEVAEIGGTEAVVTGGLSEGASVVIEGQNQLRAGIKVTISRTGKGGGGGGGKGGKGGDGKTGDDHKAGGDGKSGDDSKPIATPLGSSDDGKGQPGQKAPGTAGEGRP